MKIRKRNLLSSLLLLFLSTISYAQDNDVVIIPDNTRFEGRVIVERLAVAPTPSSLARGRIFFDEICQCYKGDTGVAIITFSTSNIVAHNILSITHGDTTVASAAGGDLLKFDGPSQRWVRHGIGTANQILGANNTASNLEYKSILGTTNQVTVTHGVNSITLSLPQSIATGSSPTFVSVTAATFVSTVATGTAPLTIASTTLVTNLNADLLDSQTGSFYQNANNINAGLLAFARGGLNTDISASAAIGDILCANTSTTFARVTGNITTTKKFANQVGDGANSACPTWLILAAADIPNLPASIITSGQIPVTRGGVGSDFSATVQGSLYYFSGTGIVSTLSPGTSGQFLKTSGAGANPVWSNVYTSIRKASDESVTNNTLQNDNELLFAIPINETWTFEFVIFATSTSGTPDIKFAFTIPSGAITTYGVIGATVGTASSPVTSMTVEHTATAGVALSGGLAANDLHTFILRGSVVNAGNAGNVTLQWAQDVTNATASTVKAGSFLNAFRVL
jgi:hypothetical protein